MSSINKKELKDIKVSGKKVLVRVDFNVPIKDGIIMDDNRIIESLPTIKYLISNNAKIILFSHLGKIKTKSDLIKYDMKPISKVLEKRLNYKVNFIDVFEGKKLEDAIDKMKEKDLILVQNTRFADFFDVNSSLINSNSNDNLLVNRESGNDSYLGKYWASLGDVFVNDAFATAHRIHASNVGIATYIKESCLGFLIQKEIKMLNKGFSNPKRPFVAIIGGAKVSDKINIINNLLDKADKILIGGGMAYTFIAAQGNRIGKSLLDNNNINVAKEFLKKSNGKIFLPIDHLEANKFADVSPKITNSIDIDDEYIGLDIGPKSIQLFKDQLASAKTILWNGPMGVFEFDNYSVGTKSICEFIVSLKNIFILIGGGDSAAAVSKFGYISKFMYISTGGGASLKYMEGGVLPGIKIIQDK